MNRYLTTTLPYVNGDPHLGHALEFIQADALVRIWRARGDKVFFNTGTDEHGQKIYEAAQKTGQDVKAYVDHYAGEFRRSKEAFGLVEDLHFIRTTDQRHIEAAQEMWRRCEAAGDIYKRAFTGLYCVGCEAFKTERELADGHCELHPNLTLEEVTEENYFFNLSRYQERLKEYLSNPDSTFPSWRRVEALMFVEKGLEDVSISRDKARIPWGIPVPGDDTQVMYVWFDALTSYISTLGWPQGIGDFETFWKEGKSLQLAGKDQVRFQSIIWQAMLMSAEIKNTDQIFYHGFINSGGQKMSKSLGNVISPYELIAKYGKEATRYLLLRHVHPTDDSDVTWERLDEWYTAHLVNGIGNLVARVMKLAEEHLAEPVALEPFVRDSIADQVADDFKFNDALDAVFVMIGHTDAHMNEQEPYKKIKNPDTAEEARQDIRKLVQEVGFIAEHLRWSMPDTAEAILCAIAENKKPENLFPRLP